MANLSQQLNLLRIAAGGPGSGRRPGDGSGKLAEKAFSLQDKHENKAISHYDRGDQGSQNAWAFHDKMGNHHMDIAEHYENAFNAYKNGDMKQGDRHMAKGDKLASKTAELRQRTKTKIFG